MNGKNIISLIFVFLCMVRVAVASDNNYMVTKEESHKNIERDVEVTLLERVDEQTLKDISQEIKDAETKNYQKTFIGYRLATGGDSFFWARASYEPELTVKIIGEPVETHNKLMSGKTPTLELKGKKWKMQD